MTLKKYETINWWREQKGGVSVSVTAIGGDK
jgi:hypothetical protein